MDEALAECGQVHLLPVGDRVDDIGRFGGGVRPHRRRPVELRDPERHDGDRVEFVEAVEDPGERVVERRTVVDPRTDDDLPAHGDAVVEQCPQPAQAHPSTGVLEHLAAEFGIGGVDAHVQRGEALGDHPLEVGLGEAGERGEVAVEERQPVVVVLQVEAAAHPLGELVDETELAVVVAGADPIEYCTRHLDPERLAFAFVDRQREVESASAQVEVDHRVVARHLPLDDVAGDDPADPDDLVAGSDARVGGGRSGSDRHDDRRERTTFGR